MFMLFKITALIVSNSLFQRAIYTAKILTQYVQSSCSQWSMASVFDATVITCVVHLKIGYRQVAEAAAHVYRESLRIHGLRNHSFPGDYPHYRFIGFSISRAIAEFPVGFIFRRGTV
jgi:hypothetical protein